MAQKGPSPSLRVRRATHLYFATVAIFLLAVLVGLAIVALSSEGIVRGVTITGAGGILASLALLLKGPISQFYDNASAEDRYEHYLISREITEARLRRNFEKLSPTQQAFEYHLLLEQREDERRAFDSLGSRSSRSTRRPRTTTRIQRERQKPITSRDAKSIESESR
jgi:hypothetical protein